MAPNNEDNKENQQLTSQDLGEVTKTKKKGPVTVLVIMVVLLAFVIWLPHITDFIKNINLRNIVVPTVTDDEKETDDDKEEEEEIVYYDFLETTSITYDGVTYTGFKTTTEDDNYLEFSATNTKANSYNLGTKNLYLELYDNAKTLLERVKIASSTSLEKDSAKTFKFLINQGLVITELRLVSYTEDDYPAIDITADSNGISHLTCTNLQSQLVYEFSNNNLVKITETYNYTNTDLEKYAEVLTAYKAKQQALDVLDGITASLVESGVNFSYNAVTDLNTANISTLNDSTYFVKNTLPKVINFEMEAMRYTCE